MTVLNVETTLERLAGDQELFGEIAQILIMTAPAQLESIGAALQTNDLKSAYEEAHSLKGAVGAFEAPEVFTQVAAVEKLARADDAAGAHAAFAAAQPLVQVLLSELAPFAPAA
ncbi:MAG TPA: Hpt domain-containing protein [Burkholderiales bacterium]|nr:Hpt domain-containing protein [Burkholderiales bacterium]